MFTGFTKTQPLPFLSFTKEKKSWRQRQIFHGHFFQTTGHFFNCPEDQFGKRQVFCFEDQKSINLNYSYMKLQQPKGHLQTRVDLISMGIKYHNDVEENAMGLPSDTTIN